jgi:hypothetical protein
MVSATTFLGQWRPADEVSGLTTSLEPPTLSSEKPLFHGQTAAESMQRMVRTDNAMARYHQRERVLRHDLADRPRSLGSAYSTRKFRISHHLSGSNAGATSEDLAGERR